METRQQSQQGPGDGGSGERHFVDARGLDCPLPLLKTRQALRRLAVGELLEVAASDPGSDRDIPAYLGQSPHRLVRREQHQDGYRFIICRGEEAAR